MNKESRLNKRIEDKFEVQTYLDRLKYAIKSGSGKITFQKEREVDEDREKEYTNRYTVSHLLTDEDEVEALKRELSLLTVEDYIETVKDFRFANYSEMRVFGKEYENKDVYIKIRVELVNTMYAAGDSFILVMSFHFAEIPFQEDDFPYRK